MWASTLWPFWSSTLKVALRRHSRTVPSSSMPFDVLAIVSASSRSRSAEDQFEVAAGAPGADALEQRRGGYVGLGHLGRGRVLADVVQRAQCVAQQRTGDPAPLAVGPHGDQPYPWPPGQRRDPQQTHVVAGLCRHGEFRRVEDG